MVVRLIESTAWPPEGPVRVFQEPLRGHSYVIGADVAEGLQHGDYSSAHVIDVGTGVVAATWHDHVDPDLFGQHLALLGRYFNTALVGVEINNHGHVTVTALRRLHYPRLFRRRAVGQVVEGFAPQFGWHTNKVSKPKMIEALNTAIREGSIKVMCEHTLAELRTYVREFTAAGAVRLHGSPYDDRVMSLAIAVVMMEYAHVDVEEERKDDYWTLDWWLRQAQEADAVDATTNTTIGQHSVRAVSGGTTPHK